MKLNSGSSRRPMIPILSAALALVLILALAPSSRQYQGTLQQAAFPAAGPPAVQEPSSSKEAEPPPESEPAESAPSFPYQELYPDLYCPDFTGESIPAAQKTVYLTFDDGPSDRTAWILDTLKKNDVKATFFVVGKNAAARGDLLRRIVEEGHTLAIHSNTHNYRQIYASVDSFLADFEAVYRLIEQETGVKPSIFRFPGGSINAYNAGIYPEIIAEMTRRGFRYYDWNVSAQDAAASISVLSVKQGIWRGGWERPEATVLMHEKWETATALDEIIYFYRSHDYTFAPLDNKVTPIIFDYKRCY